MNGVLEDPMNAFAGDGIIRGEKREREEKERERERERRGDAEKRKQESIRENNARILLTRKRRLRYAA